MNTIIETHYSITHNAWGTVTTKWFDNKEQAKRYAKSVVRLGYAPSIIAQDLVEDGYVNVREHYLDLGYTAWALINQQWWARD